MVPATECAAGPAVCSVAGVVNGLGGAIKAANGFADFWSDPAGNSFIMLQDAARSLSETLLPALTRATLPDLTAEWFITAYKVSFGLAIFVFIVVLIPQFVRVARGQQSGRELGESLTVYTPVFLIGSAFGPALGAFLVKFFGSLSDSLVAWGIGGSSQTIVDKFSGMLSEGDGAAFAGGAVLGVILMIFMLIGLLLVLLMLIVQLITLYFSGVLFPLGFVWIVDPQKRKFGSKIAYLWLGILASHPLLFFMLAIAYSMMAGQVSVFSETPTLQKTVTLVVAILSLLIAGLSPVILARFAPVIPTGGGGAVPMGAMIGSQSMQEADAKRGDSAPPAAPTPSFDTTPDTSSSSSPKTSGSSPASTGEPATSSVTEATSASSRAGGASLGAETGGAAASGASASGAAASGAAASGAAAGGAAAAGGGAIGGSAAAEGGLMAAGAAESATGVGAAIGIPTMIAAGAVAAVDATKKMTDSVGDAAVAPVDDHDEHYGKDSTHE